jgi:hypothetical protein
MKQLEERSTLLSFFLFPDKRELDIRSAAESGRLPNPHVSVGMARTEGESCRLPL